MDPKISKKTQDTLGKIIKKPPLTEKLLSKPPFRFLHDIMTSVIKTTGTMKGLYTDSEMNSENVKDKESKIAFLQKAIDFTIAASGKQLGVKPAKVVAGHEPEKTNEFLQALAAAINANVNNDDIVGKVTGKSSGGSSKKEEKKDERREKSADRRKRDEDKKSRDKSADKERSRDRDERHKDRDEKHRDKERHKEDRHKEDRHKDREKEDRHKDRESERESRHKSGRSRNESSSKGKAIVTEADHEEGADKDLDLDYDVDVTDIKSDENCNTPFPTPDITNTALNSTYAVIKPIPRQVSTYCEMKRDDQSNQSQNEKQEQAEFEEVKRRAKRPKAARPRRRNTYDMEDVPDSTSADDVDLDASPQVNKQHVGNRDEVQDEHNEIVQETSKHDAEKAGMRHRKAEKSRGPKTSTPKNSPDRPAKVVNEVSKRKEDKANSKSAKYGDISPRKLGQPNKGKSLSVSPGKRNSLDASDSTKRRTNELNAAAKKRLRKGSVNEKQINAEKEDNDLVVNNQTDDKVREIKKKHRSKSKIADSGGDSDREKASPGKKDNTKYRDNDYAHERVKKKKKRIGDLHADLDDSSDMRDSDDQYYKKKRPHGSDKRRRSSFTSVFDTGSQRRGDEEGKENDAPAQEMVNGDHNPQTAAPAKMQRPSSAKGSRRRMEAPVTFTEGGGLDSSDDEDVPAQRQEPTLGQDDLPPQVQGRLARPSSARPAPPKRKEDMAQSEPTMRLGSGKPQNLIIDDGKDEDEDEDETFVVEESAPPPPEPTQQTTVNNEEEDEEDHGGLVKKIMETKKEYEQPRETKVERPTISDAQRRKQREAVQREIDKLRGSIQTLTRSANPLGKIMDYVQEDLDSMQKELEKWKEENKEHALALKREKAITDRAIEPLKVQLSEVDQQIKDQLDLIGAVKCNIIRNDQKIEKMLRTIAKS